MAALPDPTRRLRLLDDLRVSRRPAAVGDRGELRAKNSAATASAGWVPNLGTGSPAGSPLLGPPGSAVERDRRDQTESGAVDADPEPRVHRGSRRHGLPDDRGALPDLTDVTDSPALSAERHSRRRFDPPQRLPPALGPEHEVERQSRRRSDPRHRLTPEVGVNNAGDDDGALLRTEQRALDPDVPSRSRDRTPVEVADPRRRRWHWSLSWPRWDRLRDRWVPEPLQDARIDPGRRGSMTLALVAAVAAVATAFAVWGGSSAAAPVPPVPGPDLVAQTSAGPSSVVAGDAVVSEAVASASASSAPTEIVVAVTGAVKSPGVVTLPAGSRVADAIREAGGFSDGVDYTGLNLAAKLADGDSVVVGGPGQGVAGVGGGSGGQGGPAGSAPLVDLNTADQATLETLPGVGPVMAANMLSWRETNGAFTSVDQLQEITGIGPARFATLAPLVTV